MSIQITRTEKSVSVKAPYHPTFVSRVKKLNGKWDGKAWAVDLRDEQALRDLCRVIYGTDGDDKPALVDIRVAITSSESVVFDYGRMLCERRGRDERVKLGDGVVIVEGSFAGSGGSRANPKLITDDRTVVLEVRDVPECLIDDDCTVVRRHELVQPQAPAQQGQDAPGRPFEALSDADFANLVALVTAEQAARQPAMGEGDDLAGSAIRAEMAMAYQDDEG